jgi:hypothetical protein
MEQGPDMTDIPKARKLLEQGYYFADSWAQLEGAVAEALTLMTRKVRKARVSKTTVPMTAELGAEARRLHRTTDLTDAEIGHKLNINGGRVSEALNGQWY